jgi:oligopeptide transport system substrate-binding protein
MSIPNPTPRPASLFLGLTAWLLASCSPLGGKADFTFLNGAEVESLDPAVVSGQPESRLCQALFEGLVMRNAKGEVEPGLAVHWELSADGLTYTFHLRPSVWSNGDAFSASNFVQSWERTLRPTTAARNAEQLFPLRNAEAYNKGTMKDFTQVGVRAIDPQTLEVTLTQPTPYFLDLCAYTTYLPTHTASIQQHPKDWTKPGKLVSNGAYALEAWRIDDRIRLRANPKYWRAERVRFQTIDALSLQQSSTAFNLFYSGKADLVLDKSLVPDMFIDQIRSQSYYHANPFLGTYFYRFNVTRPPFNDARVRRAFALALDKERLVTRITRAGEPSARSFCPPGIPNYTPANGLEFNPAEARRLLAEAGYPEGHNFPNVSLLFNSSEREQNIATEVQAIWREHLGVRVQLRNQETKVYYQTMRSRDYDIARSSWVGDYNDPNTFLDCFVTNRGNNRTGWSYAPYDALLASANAEREVAKRMTRLREAETLLVEKEMPIVPIYYYVGVMLYDGKKLGGIEPNVVDVHPLREMYWK